jgi:Polyketide cyclase / dehydrase and lipid transport
VEPFTCLSITRSYTPGPATGFTHAYRGAQPQRLYASLLFCQTWTLINVFGSVCIEAPAAQVWAALARLEDIELWSEAVLEARCDGPISRGPGAERTCELRGGITIKERWLEWNEGRSFTYEGLGIPLVARARNVWSVHTEGERTLLTSRAQLELKGGLLGRLLEPIVRYQINRIGPRTLAAFKYVVEHGEPPPVKHASLPAIPVAC